MHTGQMALVKKITVDELHSFDNLTAHASISATGTKRD